MQAASHFSADATNGRVSKLTALIEQVRRDLSARDELLLCVLPRASQANRSATALQNALSSKLSEAGGAKSQNSASAPVIAGIWSCWRTGLTQAIY